MALIETISHEDATGELKEIYDGLVKSRGKIAEVHKLQSLNPPTLVAHMDLYMSIMFSKSPLKRMEREMIAVVVSGANNCAYCIRHHAEALLHYWKDQTMVEQLSKDFGDVELSEKDYALCAYADRLTTSPDLANDVSLIRPLQNLGFDDRAILDATLVISYFNFVNRMVLGLGVQLEEEPGGYNY